MSSTDDHNSSATSFDCSTDRRKPASLLVLYSANSDAGFLRSVEQSKEVADALWSSVLGNLTGGREREVYAQLCFNYNNPLVRRLAALTNRALLQRSVQMLYVQALLLGHHPLNAREMALLNDGLLGLIEWGVQAEERNR